MSNSYIHMSNSSLFLVRHNNEAQKEICLSTKLMMMHVRDCPGTTATFDVCPYPWCRKTKHLLYHLVSCEDPESCDICSPVDISYNLRALKGLNEFRKDRIKERFCTPISSEPSGNIDTGQSKSIGPISEPGNLVSGKKNLVHKRVQKMTSVPLRTVKSTVPVAPKQNLALNKMPLTVPSPIPPNGEDSNTGLLKMHPTTKVGGGSLSGHAMKKPTSAGLANPLLANINAAISTVPTKISSPPNPLKGLPRDSPTDNITKPKSISQFPNLPTQIKSDENLNARRADPNSVQIKTENIS
jgi:hypothetical protein